MVVLAAVVERGSFSAAARVLGVTKAAISKQIGVLEQELGVVLLRRTTRTMTLTEEGERFHERCAEIVRLVEDAQRVVADQKVRPTGTLRISAPVGPGQSIIAPAVRTFCVAYPDLRVELHLDDALADLASERFDIAIRAARLPDSTLVARKIADLSMLICASPKYLRKHGEPRTPKDLLEHAWLGYTVLGDPQRLTFEGSRHSVRLRGRSNTNDGVVLREWLLAGLGVTMLPDFWVRDLLARGRLRVVLPDFKLASGAIHAVHAYGSRPPPKVRLFIDHLVARG